MAERPDPPEEWVDRVDRTLSAFPGCVRAAAWTGTAATRARKSLRTVMSMRTLGSRAHSEPSASPTSRASSGCPRVTTSSS